jgi:hypothetical protein
LISVSLAAALGGGAERAATWQSDFVGHLGRSDDESNPSDKIKLRLPASAKVTSTLSAMQQRG